MIATHVSYLETTPLAFAELKLILRLVEVVEIGVGNRWQRIVRCRWLVFVVCCHGDDDEYKAYVFIFIYFLP